MPHACRSVLAATLVLAAGVTMPAALEAQKSTRAETLFYLTDSDNGFASFRDHVDAISIVGPQSFAVDSDGVVWGEVDPRVLDLAKQHHVKVMPLVVNTGFDQAQIHALLNDRQARARAVATLVELGRRHKFWGWQFDLEDIHLTDRDSLTAFYRQTAKALHAAGMKLSIAVVPWDGRVGSTRWHRYMRANWREAYDLAALARIGDFISLMTYSEHNSGTPPGPVAGLPWMRANVEYTLSLGVPPERISLGVPTYSAHWQPGYQPGASGTGGLHPTAREIPYARAMSLLSRYGVEPQWLEQQGVYYAFWDHDGAFEYIFLEEHRSFAAKLDLLRQEGLRGISVWVLGDEDPAVWKVVSQKLDVVH
ncbi:MAG: glycosyl hydrolase family 18 protein [Gemmatimonadota bacterium]|jgi:spore germination protein YaaH